MRAITVKQPWASLIVEPDPNNIGFGIKDIENRTWKCPEKYIGQRVLIHASMVRQGSLYELLKVKQIEIVNNCFDRNTNYNAFPRGAIIGSVEIVDCVINHPSIWAEKPAVSDYKIYNWVLANPIKFPEPIPAKGKLSFWEFDLKCPEFAHFGASYPDARCINGFLWDLDSVDGEFLTIGGDQPCPYCNPSEYLECYDK